MAIRGMGEHYTGDNSGCLLWASKYLGLSTASTMGLSKTDYIHYNALQTELRARTQDPGLFSLAFRGLYFNCSESGG